MTDIAERAGVTRVTVYRYFAERNHLAYEVAGRMLAKLAETSAAAVPAGAGPVEAVKARIVALVTQFEPNRDAHPYLTMFNSLQPFLDTDEELDRWYRERSRDAAAFGDGSSVSQHFDEEAREQLVTLLNVLIGVLGRFAAGGEGLERWQRIAVEPQLVHLEELALGYFDEVIAPQAKPC